MKKKQLKKPWKVIKNFDFGNIDKIINNLKKNIRGKILTKQELPNVCWDHGRFFGSPYEKIKQNLSE